MMLNDGSLMVHGWSIDARLIDASGQSWLINDGKICWLIIANIGCLWSMVAHG